MATLVFASATTNTTFQQPVIRQLLRHLGVTNTEISLVFEHLSPFLSGQVQVSFFLRYETPNSILLTVTCYDPR